jgi:hypothetical protein
MLKVALIGLLVAAAGALGYFGESYLRPTKAPAPEGAAMEAEESVLLFKLPLGKFTMQISQQETVLHLLFDIDVYVNGATSFHEINGSMGKARLRDAVVLAVAELAETDLEFSTGEIGADAKEDLAHKIVRKLYVNFPRIRTARVNSFITNTTLRN